MEIEVRLLAIDEAGAPLPVDRVPFDEARISAPDIRTADNSVQVRTGLWRTMRPVIDYDHCNRCWWVCSTFCPDSAITVDADQRPVIDYDHCKGCMICVAKCPPHAITASSTSDVATIGPETSFIASSVAWSGGSFCSSSSRAMVLGVVISRSASILGNTVLAS